MPAISPSIFGKRYAQTMYKRLGFACLFTDHEQHVFGRGCANAYLAAFGHNAPITETLMAVTSASARWLELVEIHNLVSGAA